VQCKRECLGYTLSFHPILLAKHPTFSKADTHGVSWTFPWHQLLKHEYDEKDVRSSGSLAAHWLILREAVSEQN
jgi:hypothetical protein